MFAAVRRMSESAGMARRSKVHPNYKTRYRITNWASYDRALVKRGSLTVWFSPEAIGAWTPKNKGRRGGQRRYSNIAVQTALYLRLLFRQPWRQTEGLLRSIVELLGLRLEGPDHTTLSRRARELATRPPRWPSRGAMHLRVDASGLKIFGQGEWAAARYGNRSRRVGWRKLHLGVDEGGHIVAAELTDKGVADASVLPTLLTQIDRPIRRLTADGGYDRREVYVAAVKRGAHVVIPPQRGAVISRDPILRTRNRHIRRMEKVGRAQWRREKGHHCQARVENSFYRYKRIFGPAIRARHPLGQRAEVMAACTLLNRMTLLAMSASQRIDR